MKKNVKLHLWIDSELLVKLHRQAEKNQVTLAEICRQKLREDLKSDKIFYLIERIAREVK
tara:strand:+ start:194 stop:373 length:180 start_codon:yes stop_codon:yes gene_type:complete